MEYEDELEDELDNSSDSISDDEGVRFWYPNILALRWWDLLLDFFQRGCKNKITDYLADRHASHNGRTRRYYTSAPVLEHDS